LVDFQGTIAYEVRLNWGNVYVAANSGQILYNGATPPAQVAPSGAASAGQGEDDDAEGDD
jgi:hypothetical protein